MNKIKKLISILAISFISINSLFLCNINSNAEELSTTDRNRLLGAVPREWESANIREWLNSNKEDVDYTAIPPTYEEEKGFLHTDNFTVEEYEAIAITKHSGGDALIVNQNNTKYLSMRISLRRPYIYNDKVFILNTIDLYNYLERNDVFFDYNKKYYSNYLQEITNKKDKYGYITNSGAIYGNYNGQNNFISSDVIVLSYGQLQNIVPALSLKPDYVLSNGIKAKDLELGSSVYFGSYNNEPIEWQVINISDEGYPLLWSTKIIIQKEYDEEGDINPTKSDFINFETYDVDISSGTGQNRSWETGNTITSTPVINILNEEVLTTPTYEESITIQIQATDEIHGIRSITLPDGTKVYDDYTEYTLTDNGEYTLMVENSEGVVTTKYIITRAINAKAEVIISTNKDENNKWTNKPVNVSINTNNNGMYTQTINGKEEASIYSNNLGVSYPSWMTLGNKQVRITGTFYNTITDEDIEKYNLNMNNEIRLRFQIKEYSISSNGHTWPLVMSIPLRDLKEQGSIEIDTIYTLPSNTYMNVVPYITFMDRFSAYMKEGYSYGFSDFTYELLEKDPLEIVEIHMPNNNIVYDNKATYTVFENGTYTFTAVDNNGESFSKDIELAIDTVKPNIDITYDNTPTNDILTLDLKAYDDLSGIKSIKLPNGEYRTNESDMLQLDTTYNIVENGTYTFVVTDFANNTTTKSITITNVDRIPPNMEYNLNPSTFTNQDVTINVQATDEGFGYSHMILPNGSITSLNNINYTVNENGVYYFLAYDNIGNESSLKVKIDIVDRNRPTVDIIKDPNNNNWVNEDVNITIDSEDN